MASSRLRRPAPASRNCSLRATRPSRISSRSTMRSSRTSSISNGSSCRSCEFALAPDSLSIDRVRVVKPFTRVIVSSDAVLNVSAVFDPQGTAAAVAQAKADKAAQAGRAQAQEDARRDPGGKAGCGSGGKGPQARGRGTAAGTQGNRHADPHPRDAGGRTARWTSRISACSRISPPRSTRSTA